MTAKTTLIIARHGNTFEAGETPRRVGLGTDLPLTEAGIDQARRMGAHLKANNLLPDAAFTSYLCRTQQTARMALAEAGCTLFIQPDALFNEIDYGPDENKTEDEVIARIGAQALKDWDEQGVMPNGWEPDPFTIIDGWLSFGGRMADQYPGCRILVVTSNGIARFAPYLTGAFEDFRRDHKLKIATGALATLEHDGSGWAVTGWNIKP